MDSGTDSTICVLASTTKRQYAGHPQKMRITLEKLPGYYSGTGDIFASLLLCRLSENIDKLDDALEASLGSIQGILKQTYEHDRSASVGGLDAESCNSREVRLIQEQHFLLQPLTYLKSIPLE